MTVDYLSGQIVAGADAVQLFDSWAGSLSPDQFERWVIAPTARIVADLKARHPETPIIGFPKGAGAKLAAYARETGVDALGLDETIDPDWAVRELPEKLPLQGNLDPLALLAGGAALEKAVGRILSSFHGRPHIFNLGHGIIKETPIAHVEQLLELVRNAGAELIHEIGWVLTVLYAWLKAGHVIFVIFWVAGLFMLPRYYVYHQESAPGSDEEKRWIERETKLRNDHHHSGDDPGLDLRHPARLGQLRERHRDSARALVPGEVRDRLRAVRLSRLDGRLRQEARRRQAPALRQGAPDHERDARHRRRARRHPGDRPAFLLTLPVAGRALASLDTLQGGA